MLHVEAIAGPSSGATPAWLVHGFTQNVRCWGPFADELGTDRPVNGLDAPGHGRSHDDQADLVEAAELLAASGGPGHWLGYSMGGRMLLHAALAGPAELFESITLIGATGGLDDEAERIERRGRDSELAARLEAQGLASFLDAWLASPLFADLDDEQACRPARLLNRPAGLAASLRNCGTGTQVPLWDRLHAIEVPVLVVAGTADAKFTGLGHRLVDAIGPNARFAGVDGGHAVHLERPVETAATVRRFWAER